MHVQTVTGPVSPKELGPTLMHEHLDSVAPGCFYSGGEPAPIDDLVAGAVGVLNDLGLGALVDLSGRARVDERFNRIMAKRLGPQLPFKVIVGFSFYKDPWLGASAEQSTSQLAGIYIRQATVGTDGVKAGIFGEVGTSFNQITPGEEKHLRAATRAQRETGLAISTHCTLGTMALEQTEILEAEGADMTRVVLGHLDLRPDLKYLKAVLATGANLGFDTFGKEHFDYSVPDSAVDGAVSVKRSYLRPDDDRIAALVELCTRGLDAQIVLSCDLSGAEAWLNPNTHGRHGFAYFHRVVVPRLREAGVSDEALHRMLVENPARILAVP